MSAMNQQQSSSVMEWVVFSLSTSAGLIGVTIIILAVVSTSNGPYEFLFRGRQRVDGI